MHVNNFRLLFFFIFKILTQIFFYLFLLLFSENILKDLLLGIFFSSDWNFAYKSSTVMGVEYLKTLHGVLNLLQTVCFFK